MKRCRHTQTLWDAQFEHEGRTYSVDALLDSRWTLYPATYHEPKDIVLEDFELVNVDIAYY